jgi:DNA adenine methylase
MTYDGGKNAVFHHIVNQMPPHRAYVELFLGSGAVMRHKRAAEINIGVEINPQQCDLVKPFLPASAELVNSCSLKFLRSQFRLLVPATAETLIYADPPYLLSTRSSQRDLYDYEFATEAEHRELLQLLSSTGSRVIISGYASSLYAQMLRGWRRVEYQAIKRNGKKATEILWCNFPEVAELHDYTFLGSDRTERQRIKRKRLRWTERLKKMPQLERLSVLAAVADYTRSTLPAMQLKTSTVQQP